jgi:hypothetical protein
MVCVGLFVFKVTSWPTTKNGLRRLLFKKKCVVTAFCRCALKSLIEMIVLNVDKLNVLIKNKEWKLKYSIFSFQSKGPTRSRKSKKNIQYISQMKKDKRTNNDPQKNPTEIERPSNANPTNNRVWTEVLRKG